MLIYYLLIMNAVAIFFMLLDKHKAKTKQWRIPEATLWAIALLGGSLGVLMGMYLARHKTRHLSFSVGMPILLVLQLTLGIILWAKI